MKDECKAKVFQTPGRASALGAKARFVVATRDGLIAGWGASAVLGAVAYTTTDDDGTHLTTVLRADTLKLDMSAADLEQAVAIPLPTSPPTDGSHATTFPLPDVDGAPAEFANGVHAKTDEEEERAESVESAAEEMEDVALDGPGEVKEPADSASSQESTAHGEAESTSATVDSVQPRQSTATTPPTPPSKPLPEVRTPPPRHDSLTPGSTTSPNGRVRDSVDHVDPRRMNGHGPTPQDALSRPSSAASHRRSLTISKGRTVSAVLVSSALETIAASREAKRSQPLRESVQRALEMVKRGEGGDRPREIFEPLRLACETRNEKLMIASLDCISKLISYSFFVEAGVPTNQGLPSPPPSPGPGSRQSTSSNAPSGPGPSLVDLVVFTITSCHTESSPETVSLQIVKALLALVLSSTILVHQSSLLKAIRTVYNVFLLSVDPINQTVAQGGLTQMVNHVFARCKVDSLSRTNSSSTLVSRLEASRRRSLAPDSPMHYQTPLSPPPSNEHAEIAEPASPYVNENIARAQQSMDTPRSEAAELPEEGQTEQDTDAGSSRPSSVAQHQYVENHLDRACDTHRRFRRHPLPPPSEYHGEDDDHEPFNVHMSTNDLFIKDAFLVFRALCKLTMKPLNPER